MIPIKNDVFYDVYPSWSKLQLPWEKLEEIFQDPFLHGYLDDRPRYVRLGYTPGTDRFKLINGPVGNGIIQGQGDLVKSRYFWLGAIIQRADFRPLNGFPAHKAPQFGVHWLDEKNSAEHKLGLLKKFPVYEPLISADFADCPDSVVYVSLAFGKNLVDEEVTLRFQARCQVFGMKCQPIDSLESLPKTALSLTSPVIAQHWFKLENIEEDAGQLVAKMYYLACAAKQESTKRFRSLHMVGAFEGRPVMAQNLALA
jgi:hypothetical protein